MVDQINQILLLPVADVPFYAVIIAGLFIGRVA